MIVTLIGDLLAELVQSLHSSVVMGVRLVCLPILFLEVGPVAHVVTEELRQVLGAAVGNGPFVVLGVPLGSLGILCFLFGLFLLLFLFFLAVALFRCLFFGFFNDDLLLHVWGDNELGFLFIAL